MSAPKILGKMSSKDHFCVSFKLETDKKIIKEKMDTSFEKYNVDMIIGNMLNNKEWIWIRHNPHSVNKNDYEINKFTEKEIVKGILEGWNIKYT